MISTSYEEKPAVAFIHWLFLGYTETFLYQQLKRLNRYRPEVFAQKLENLDRFPWDNIHMPPEPRGVMARLQAFSQKAYIPAWAQTMKKQGVTVIHAHYGPIGLSAVPYKLHLKIPLITSFYGFDVGILEQPDVPTNRRAWPVYVRFPWVLWNKGDLFLALSRVMRDDMIRLGCPPEKIRVQPNGVDLERFRVVDRRGRSGCVVAMCGWEVEKKGFTYGFQAVKKAISTGADLRVRWLGVHGPLREQLIQEIGTLGLSDRVEILPEREDPKALFESADLVLCPSITDSRGNKEGVPTVLVESAATGIPAVASRHAGIPEIVLDGESGFLYPERDVEGLAEGLTRFAKDPELRFRFGQRARQKAEQDYNAETLSRKLEDYYDEVQKR